MKMKIIYWCLEHHFWCLEYQNWCSKHQNCCLVRNEIALSQSPPLLDRQNSMICLVFFLRFYLFFFSHALFSSHHYPSKSLPYQGMLYLGLEETGKRRSPMQGSVALVVLRGYQYCLLQSCVVEYMTSLHPPTKCMHHRTNLFGLRFALSLRGWVIDRYFYGG